MPDFIYLASQSPRRRQLLEQLGVRYDLLLPNVECDEAEDTEAIEVVAYRLRKKLAATGSGARLATLRGLGYLLKASA